MRGLDYYRHTAFEFITDRLGAQGTVLGGGRYDGLIENLGGPATPAVGWAAGIERLAMLTEAPAAPIADVALVVENDARIPDALARATALRRAGLAVEMVAEGSARKRFDKAVKLATPAVLALDLRDGEPTERLRCEDGALRGRVETTGVCR